MRLEPPSPLPIIEGVFNELCLEHPFLSAPEAAQGLRDLYRLIRALKCRTWDQGDGQKTSQNTVLYNLNRLFRDVVTAEGLTGSSLIKSLKATQDKEFVDAFRNLLSKSLECPPSDDVATLKGRPAPGLSCARDRNALALSLLTDSRWDTPSVTLDNGAPVIHIAQEGHLTATGDWFSQRLGDFTAFLRLVQPENLKHVPASQYKKHVRGSTDEERQRHAQGGDGQYLARSGAQVLDDEGIQALERTAIIALRQGRPDARLVLHSGSTFHILYTHSTTVGFAGGAGAPTRKIRVEWSNGSVHSHPREW